jgi:hypothetical protein
MTEWDERIVDVLERVESWVFRLCVLIAKLRAGSETTSVAPADATEQLGIE